MVISASIAQTKSTRSIGIWPSSFGKARDTVGPSHALSQVDGLDARGNHAARLCRAGCRRNDPANDATRSVNPESESKTLKWLTEYRMLKAFEMFKRPRQALVARG
jgi:hypothetical protein